MNVVPGEVYLADIFEGGTRPVVIVSREQLNPFDSGSSGRAPSSSSSWRTRCARRSSSGRRGPGSNSLRTIFFELRRVQSAGVVLPFANEPARQPRYLPWGDLLKRVFDLSASFAPAAAQSRASSSFRETGPHALVDE